MKLGISEKGLRKLARIAQEDEDFATVEYSDYDENEYGDEGSASFKKLTRTEIKQTAQDAIMAVVSNAFHAISDNPEYSEDDKERIYTEIDKQMSRIERLFGYDIGSWGRW